MTEKHEDLARYSPQGSRSGNDLLGVQRDPGWLTQMDDAQNVIQFVAWIGDASSVGTDKIGAH